MVSLTGTSAGAKVPSIVGTLGAMSPPNTLPTWHLLCQGGYHLLQALFVTHPSHKSQPGELCQGVSVLPVEKKAWQNALVPKNAWELSPFFPERAKPELSLVFLLL